MRVVQVDILEGLQHSKLSYSSEPDSLMHGLPTVSGLLSPDNDRAAIAPHSAWGVLLGTSLPFLLSESQAAANFLGLVKAETPSGLVDSSTSMYTTPCLLLGNLCVLLHAITDGRPLHQCQVQAFCENSINRLCRTPLASAIPCHTSPRLHSGMGFSGMLTLYDLRAHASRLQWKQAVCEPFFTSQQLKQGTIPPQQGDVHRSFC